MIGIALAVGAAARDNRALNTLSAKERADGWRLLFDGKTTNGWRGYRQQTMPGGWQAIDGALTRVGQAADIITIDEFGDFELTLEWNLSPERQQRRPLPRHRRRRCEWKTAPEYQIIDNAYREPLKPGQHAGANYDLDPPVARRDETDRLVERDAHRRTRQPRRALAERREGRRVRAVERPTGSGGFAESKFKDYPGYGRARDAATSACRTTAIAWRTGTSRFEKSRIKNSEFGIRHS